MPKKTYIVRNPRGIPKDVHILRIGDAVWYEGDKFIPPMGAKIEQLLERGFLEEVKRGEA